MRNITKSIVVTKLDIKRGKNSDNSCPVELAVRRAFNYKYNVSAGYTGASVYKDEIKTIVCQAWFNKKVRSWIVEFDGGKHVKPITFSLKFC